jgi:membrane-bound ClpP family serine protease
MDIIILTVLCVTGILLILAEIFLIPGFTVAGIAGAAFSFAGIYFAFQNLGTTAGIITLIAMAAAVGISFAFLVKSRALDAISLKTNIDSTVAEETLPIEAGDAGVTLSRLNPMGKVRVNGITVEAKTIDGFIDENTEVEVVKVFKNQLTVKHKQ